MKTIIFDKSAVSWTKDVDQNLMFLEYQANYINEIFRHRGYIYLNYIYEIFGVIWNPNLVNLCYRIESGPINFEFEPAEGGIILIKFK